VSRQQDVSLIKYVDDVEELVDMRSATWNYDTGAAPAQLAKEAEGEGKKDEGDKSATAAHDPKPGP